MTNVVKLVVMGTLFFGFSAICCGKETVEKMSATSWRIPFEHELILELKNDERHEIRTKDGLVFQTEKNHYVTQVEINGSGKTALFSVFRHGSSGGFWYSYLILLQLKDGRTAASRVLKTEDLDAIDGRDRRVSAIGTLGDFPNVELLMMFTEKVELPSKIIREWQIWNLETSKFVKVANESDQNRRDMNEFTQFMPESARQRRQIVTPRK